MPASFFITLPLRNETRHACGPFPISDTDTVRQAKSGRRFKIRSSHIKKPVHIFTDMKQQEHVPTDLLQKICQHLTRDDMANLATVRPDITTDEMLGSFPAGGVPVCTACQSSVLEQCLPTFEKHTEPTSTLFSICEIEECGSFVIPDLITLLAHQLMTKEQLPIPHDHCYICEQRDKIFEHLKSPDWLCLLEEYVLMLVDALEELYEDSREEDQLSGYQNATYMSERWNLFPFICGRCGDLSCDHSELCKWYFAEKLTIERKREEVLQQRIAEKAKCQCNNIKHDRKQTCRCEKCNNTPSSCGYCRKCCLAPTCFHNGGEVQVELPWKFYKTVAHHST